MVTRFSPFFLPVVSLVVVSVELIAWKYSSLNDLLHYEVDARPCTLV